MELGNFLFGNSRGAYPLDRSLINKAYNWDKLVDWVGLDHYGYYNGKWGQEYTGETGGFVNDIFEIFPYYWGDCESQKGANEEGDCTNCSIVDRCLRSKSNFISRGVKL